MNADRFNFRCGITVSHYDDDDNDIETLLLVNNVSIYDDGEVGFNGYYLEAAVDRANLSSEKERTLFNSLKEYEVDDEWYQMPADFIEQCTGLKDKNQILVYENDIVKSHRGEVGIIKWNNQTAQFYITKKTGEYIDYMDDICNYEVIGNIHQNCDLLGKK